MNFLLSSIFIPIISNSLPSTPSQLSHTITYQTVSMVEFSHQEQETGRWFTLVTRAGHRNNNSNNKWRGEGNKPTEPSFYSSNYHAIHSVYDTHSSEKSLHLQIKLSWLSFTSPTDILTLLDDYWSLLLSTFLLLITLCVSYLIYPSFIHSYDTCCTAARFVIQTIIILTEMMMMIANIFLPQPSTLIPVLFIHSLSSSSESLARE